VGMLRTLNRLLWALTGFLCGSGLGFIAGSLIGGALSLSKPGSEWAILFGVLGAPVGGCIGFMVGLWWLAPRPTSSDPSLEADYRDLDSRPPT
jgi:hypothetical protein